MSNMASTVDRTVTYSVIYGDVQCVCIEVQSGQYPIRDEYMQDTCF